MKKYGGYITNCLGRNEVYQMLCNMAKKGGKLCHASNNKALRNNRPFFFIRTENLEGYQDLGRGRHGDCSRDSLIGLNSKEVSLEEMINVLKNFKFNIRIVEFVYQKDNGETDWRRLQVEDEDCGYIKGIDLDKNEFRSFLKSRIIGGKILEKKK
jgi:hypothetical protein